MLDVNGLNKTFFIKFVLGVFFAIAINSSYAQSTSDSKFDSLLADIKSYPIAKKKPQTSTLTTTPNSSTANSFHAMKLTEAEELQASFLEFLEQSQKLRDVSTISANDYYQLVSNYENIQANDLLIRQYFDAESKRLNLGGVSGNVIPEHLAFIQKYSKLIQEMEERLDSKFAKAKSKQVESGVYDENYINGIWSKFRLRWSLRALSKDLEKLVVKNKLPILGAQPSYGRVTITPTAALNTNSITPVYRTQDVALTTPVDADFKGLNETELSTEILKQARLLDYDYVRIFEFVKNNIQLEWYAGSFKGAEQTLLSGSGNDVDQAALLIALYRASGLPARYVHGVVEQSIEELSAVTGIADATQILRYLKESGISYEPIVRGGRIVAINREYTWTTVYVPYSNYRGTHVDASGSTWLPLMPAVKETVLKDENIGSANINSTLIQGIKDEYLSTEQISTPVSALASTVEELLSAQDQTQSYQDFVALADIKADVLELLPNSELLTVIRVHTEEAQLSADFIPTVQIRSYQLEAATSSVVFDVELPFNEIINKRTSWSYIPAEKEHHELVNLYGGLYRTPAYLMRLRTQLKIAGRTVSVGQGSLQMGVPHRIEITFKGKFGTIVRNKTVLSGGFHGISIAYDDLKNLTRDELVGDTESEAGKILGELAQTYTSTVNASERDAAVAFKVKIARPVPSLMFVSNSNTVENLLDQPQTLNWNGVEMDALMLTASPVAFDESNIAIEDSWLDLMALNASSEEHQIFQNILLVDSISADKGLQIAKQDGIVILDITNANPEAVTALPYAQEVKDDLNFWLQKGFDIQIPESFIQRNAWQGAVWVVSNKAKGQYGYFISGRLAGGQTTLTPEEWANEWIRDLLSTPYDSLPNQEPNDAISLVKIASTDFQLAKAGTDLGRRLSVLARDAFGRPVQHVEVHFSQVLGDGQLIGEVEGDGFVIATTDFNGIASVSYKMGESTRINSRFLNINSGDIHSTQVGLSVIDARSDFGINLILEQPFSAYMLPDDASELISESGLMTVDHNPKTIMREVFQAQDQYGNPVSNTDVTVSVQPANYGQCGLPPRNPLNGAVATAECTFFDTLGECGSVTSDTKQTTSLGNAIFKVFTGNVLLSQYNYLVEGATNSYTLSRHTKGFSTVDDCDDKGDKTAVQLSIIKPAVSFISANEVYAAKIGETTTTPVKAKAQYLKYGYEVVLDPTTSEYFLQNYPDTEWVTTTADVNFSASNGAIAEESVANVENEYEAQVTASATPSSHFVEVTATNIAVTSPDLDAVTGVVTEVDSFQEINTPKKVTDFYSLEAKVLGVTSLEAPSTKNPEFIYVNGENLTIYPVRVNYQVLPNTYPALSVGLKIYVDGVFSDYLPNTLDQTQGSILIPRGYRFDLDKEYTFQAVVNTGSNFEISSEIVNIPLRSALIKSYSKFVNIYDEIDVVNQFKCSIGGELRFELSKQSYVKAYFWPKESLTYREEDAIVIADMSSEETNSYEYTAGRHVLNIEKDTLPIGRYYFELKVTSASDPTDIEEVKGLGLSRFDKTDQVPVGHTFLKGVDVFDGHLVKSSSDLNILGAGPELKFTRTYSSGTGMGVGPLGVGWAHNFNSTVKTSACGSYNVQGADGGGIRFFNVDGELKPSSGNNGTLVVDATNSFIDYYTTAGVKYHYVERNSIVETDTVAQGVVWDLKYISDPNGRTLSMTYDAEDNGRPKLLAVEDSYGRKLIYNYVLKDFAQIEQPSEVLESVVGPQGMTITFEYDDAARLIKASREGIKSEEYTYYANGEVTPEFKRSKMASYVDPNGNRTTYAYSEEEQFVNFIANDVEENGVPQKFVVAAVSEVNEPDIGISSFTYNFTTRNTEAQTPVGLKTFKSNRAGGVTEQTEPGGTKTFVWDIETTKVTSETDWANIRTDYTYDRAGNLLSSNREPNFLLEYTYAQQTSPPYVKNRLTSSKDYNQNLTVYQHDSRNNLIKTTLGPTINHYNYSADGNLISSTDPVGNVTTYNYDVYGNLERKTDNSGGVSGTVRDSRGYPTSITDVVSGTSVVTPDVLGRIVSMRNELGGLREYTYDANGNKLSETDENTHTTVWEYDKANRVIKITNPRTQVKTYSYNTQGFLVTESDWKNQLTTYGHKPSGFVNKVIHPDTTFQTYELDALGNRTAVIDERSNRTTYTYDNLNRVTGLTDPAGTVEIFLDKNGNQLSITDRLTNSTEATYNHLNLPITHINAENEFTENFYDAAGNLTSQKDANNRVRRFEYDKANRLTKKIDALGEIEEYIYNSRGLITREIDRRGGTQVHSYDVLGRKKSTRDEENSLYSYEYDPVGNLESETWPNGNSFTHIYDQLNRLTSSTDSMSTFQQFGYDANGNITLQKDGNANSVIRTYDSRNRLDLETLPEGRVVDYGYDPAGNLNKIVDPRLGETTIEYDTSNREFSRLDPAGSTSRTYDNESNIKTITDRRNKVTSFNYDKVYRIKDSLDPLLQSIKFEYDAVGNRIKEINKKNIETIYAYDAENRIINAAKAGLSIAQFVYDENGNVIIALDANDNRTASEYNLRNQILRESRTLASVNEYTYNNMGDVETARDPEGRVISYDYDHRRQLVAETLDGNTTNYTYDGNGNSLSVKKPKGNTWNYEYDAADRLVKVIDPKTLATSYTYDKNDNRDSQTDARTNTTSYIYDAANRLKKTTYPSVNGTSAAEDYTYDEESNLETLTDPKGSVITYNYDDLNRPSSRVYAAAIPVTNAITSIAYDFDANSNLVQVTENYLDSANNRITSQMFDDFDRVIQIDYPNSKTLKYQYDANGNRTRLTDADNNVTSYAYDSLNRPTSIVTANGVTNYSYDKSSAIKRVLYPTQATATYEYDNSGRVESIVNVQSGSVVSAFTYAYDKNSNPVTITEQQGATPENITYEFDNLDRLVEAEYSDKRLAYTYDAAYNRTSETITDLLAGSPTANQVVVDRGYAYNSRNQLDDVTDNLDPVASTAYAYDGNGNRASRTQAGVTTDYIYDIRDHLREIRQGGSTVGQFLYDYQGLRISKTASGATQNFVYDDQNVLQETTASGTTTAKYEYGADRLISYNHSSEGQSYYLQDNLGSVTNVLKADGAVQTRTQYDAFGQTRTQTGTSSNSVGYTGQYNDSESGLYYYKARYYDPELGSFLSQDALTGRAVTPPSLNRYLYVFANPAIYTDPTGNIEFLANLANSFDDANEQLSQLSRSDDRNTRDLTGTGKLIRFGGETAIAAKQLINSGLGLATRTVNFTANNVIARFSDNDSIENELHASYQALSAAGSSVKNVIAHPLESTGALVGAGVKLSFNVYKGDSGAITDFTRDVGSFLIPVSATVNVAKNIGSVGLSSLKQGAIKARNTIKTPNAVEIETQGLHRIGSKQRQLGPTRASAINKRINGRADNELDILRHGVTFEGSIYRAVPSDRNPLEIDPFFNKEKGIGRYSEPGVGAQYFGASLRGVKSEFSGRKIPDGYSVYKYKERIPKLLDLTSSIVRKRLGVSLDDIVRVNGPASYKYNITSVIGRQAQGAGFNGIIAPAAKADGAANLIIFNIKVIK